ncbi:MAG: Fe(2+) transporter permease subunit FeoB [Cyanobacteria bacterium]|nr:Fe(2+) transporter permease subunit FeoB [Cyanobacteriota bacterium]
MTSTTTASATITLIGNPNCGKTTLFNALTGANQQVGNWPGVTVDYKEGRYRQEGQTITVVDLPGIYSLEMEDEGSLDESIARDYLLTGSAQVVVDIIDASNLERNLYLTTQLLEMGLPLVVVLNMMDVAEKQGAVLHPERLAERLGCPVVPLVASRGQGIEGLKGVIQGALADLVLPQGQVGYPPVVEGAIAALIPAIALDQPPTPRHRWTALKLLQYDDAHGPAIAPELMRQVVEHRRRIHQVLGEDLDILVADSRYSYAHRLASAMATRPREVTVTQSDRIDQVVMNRWLGIPIFLGVMYLLFMFSINMGSAFIDFFDILAGAIFVEGLGQFLDGIGTPSLLRVILANGMGGGIQTVATFIPVIACLFLFMALLEDSGYMARAAFVMDRFMRFVGLPGKSFVPMLVGFGCNVPAIMATRTLDNRRDRILTILMNPFMSCGARLPVYALFAAAFFPEAGQNLVFLLYLIGMGMAIVTGLIMKYTLLRGEASPFVMELPTYHLPTLKGIVLRTWERLKGFLWRAGKVIVVMVMVLSVLNSTGLDGSIGHENSENSILSAMGRRVVPVFAPMGIAEENWPATVGIFTGVFAKEAVVGTLDALYGQLARDEAIAAGVDSGDGAFNFGERVKAAFGTIPTNLAALSGTLLDPLGLSVGDVDDVATAAQEQEVTHTTFGQMALRFDGRAGAFAYLLFILMYFPCAAAMGAVYRETNRGWTAFVGLWTTGLGYWSAVLYYQAMTFGEHPVASLTWMGILAAIAVGTVAALRYLRPQRRSRRQALLPEEG